MYQSEGNSHYSASGTDKESVGMQQSHVIMMPDTPSPSISKPKSNGFWTKKRILCAVVAILVLIGCGGTAFWYFCIHVTKEPQRAPSHSTLTSKPKQTMHAPPTQKQEFATQNDRVIRVRRCAWQTDGASMKQSPPSDPQRDRIGAMTFMEAQITAANVYLGGMRHDRRELIFGGTKDIQGVININSDEELKRQKGMITADLKDEAQMSAMMSSMESIFEEHYQKFDTIKFEENAVKGAIYTKEFLSFVRRMLNDHGTFECPVKHDNEKESVKGCLKAAGFCFV